MKSEKSSCRSRAPQEIQRLAKEWCRIPWMGVLKPLEEALPDLIDDRNGIAFNLTPRFMNEVFGEKGVAWDTEKRAKSSGAGTTTWIVLK